MTPSHLREEEAEGGRPQVTVLILTRSWGLDPGSSIPAAAPRASVRREAAGHVAEEAKVLEPGIS